MSKTKTDLQVELHAAQRRFVERAVNADARKRSLSQIAKAAGLHHTTLTRFMAPDATSLLDLLSIRLIEAETGYQAPGEAIGAGATAFAEEAQPYEPKLDAAGEIAIRALIGGRNGVTHLTVPSRALELAGYLPGDVVVVDLNATAQAGDAVLAQIYDWNTATARTVFRKLERAIPVDLLVPRSLDPTLQEVFVVDGQRVVIKGVITDLLRLKHPARAA